MPQLIYLGRAKKRRARQNYRGSRRLCSVCTSLRRFPIVWRAKNDFSGLLEGCFHCLQFGLRKKPVLREITAAPTVSNMATQAGLPTLNK